MPIVAWEGPSRIDKSPIIVLLTGYHRPSANRKTGRMIHSWILRSDTPPHIAVKTGEDSAICGQCPLRNGTCYVLPYQAPNQVWKSWKEGSIDPMEEWGAPRALRIGAYGDPSAVPGHVWSRLLQWHACTGRTSYTHHWKLKRAAHLKGQAMASVESIEEGHEAARKGWKYFRVGEGEPAEGEVMCKYYSNMKECSDCKLCDGRKVNVFAPVHGSSAKKLAFKKL